MYPEYDSKRRKRNTNPGDDRRKGRELSADESSFTSPSFDQFFGYGSYNRQNTEPRSDHERRKQSRSEVSDFGRSTLKRNQYTELLPDNYPEEDLIHKIRQPLSNSPSVGDIRSDKPISSNELTEVPKQLITSDALTSHKDETNGSILQMEQPVDKSISFKSSEEINNNSKTTVIDSSPLHASQAIEDAQKTNTEKLHNSISKLGLLSANINKELPSSPKIAEKLTNDGTLQTNQTNISFKNYDKKKLISSTQHEGTAEEPIKNFDTISFKGDYTRTNTEIKTKVQNEKENSESLPIKREYNGISATPNDTQIPTDLNSLSREELINQLSELRSSAPPPILETFKINQTATKQHKIKEEQFGTHRLSIPHSIIQVIFSYPKKEPIIVPQKQNSICINACFYHIETIPISNKTLNIFKFDYTMVSSMLPNKSLYTAASYTTLISPERRANVFNWFTDILPKVDACNYIKGGINNSKLYPDQLIKNQTTNSSIWNSSMSNLNYSWSKLMLLYLENSGKETCSSNMLYIDRVILDRNKLINDLKILGDHGLVFQYVICQKMGKKCPSITMAILFDEIYNRRFDWCRNIERINLFDSTNTNSVAELNHKKSRVHFSLIRPLKEITYFKNPTEELKLIYREFNRIKRVKESISLIRSGAFFYLEFYHAVKLQKLLETHQNFPTTDLHDYVYNLQHLIVSYNNLPTKIVSDIDHEAIHKASILSFGKIDKTLYAVKFLISVELDEWEFGEPIMIVAKNEKLSNRTVHSLLRKIDWNISDANLEFEFKFFEDRRIKFIRS